MAISKAQREASPGGVHQGCFGKFDFLYIYLEYDPDRSQNVIIPS